MSDPLSATASIAGLVSLGIQVVSGITKYLDAIRERKDDIASVETQVIRTQELLKLVLKVAAKADPNHSTTAAFLKDSTSVQAELQALEELVRKFDSTKVPLSSHEVFGNAYVQAKKLTYPFHRPTMERLQARLVRVNDGLQAALQVSGLDVALDIERTASAIKTTLPDLARQLSDHIKQESLANRDAVARVGDSVVSLSGSLDQGLARILKEIAATSSASVSAFNEDHADKHLKLLEEVSMTRNCVSDLSETVRGVDMGMVKLQENIATTRTTSLSLLRQDYSQTQARVLKELSVTRSGVSELHDTVKRFDLALRALPTREELGHLISKPGELREICDIIKGRPRLTTFQHSSHRSRDTLERRTCVCRQRVIRSRQALLLGPWQALVDTATAHDHFPGCVYHSQAAAVSSKRWAVVFRGLQGLTTRAIELSFSCSFGAGGSSFSPGISYYPTIDRRRDPAFRIMDLFSWARATVDQKEAGLGDGSLGEVLQQCTESMALLYRRGKASPKAVDLYGRDVLHYFDGGSLGHIDEVCLLTGLDTLMKHGVQTTTYDIHGGTPAWTITCVTSGPWDFPFGAEVYPGPGHPGHKDEKSPLTEFLCAQQPCKPIVSKSALEPILQGYNVMELFGMIQRSPATAEAFGCGPLSLAALKDDVKEMEFLLTNYPNMINELNLLKQTPLHLAVGHPACVPLLLRESGRELIDVPDIGGRRPMEYALFFCRIEDTYAIKKQFHDENLGGCLRSHGDLSLNILLDAGCMIPKVELWPQDAYLFCTSLCENCLRAVSVHLVDRREELKRLARNKLPRMQATALGLFTSSVLDSNAIRVMQALEEHGISVPPSVQVHTLNLGDGCNELTSAYHDCHSPLPFSTLWELGFRDVDTPDIDGITPLMSLCRWLSGDTVAGRGFWLIEHGVDPWKLLPDGVSTIGHKLYSRIGRWISGYSGKNPRKHVFHLTWKLSQRDPRDGCRCACSLGGCTPFVRFLQAARCKQLSEMNEDSVSEFIERLPKFLKETHTTVTKDQMLSAIRYATFEMLGIRHTCCHDCCHVGLYAVPYPYSLPHRQDQELYESCQEDRFLVARLEDLIAEFEVELNRIGWKRSVNEHVSFWQGYWLPRMQQVLESVEGAGIDQREKAAAEQIGVVWHEQESDKGKGLDFDSDSYSESEDGGYHESDWDSEIDEEDMFDTFRIMEDWTSRLNLIMSKAGLSAGR